MLSPTWILVILCSRSSCLWSKVFMPYTVQRILGNLFMLSYLSYRNWHSISTSPCIACLACSENLPEKLATVAWDRAPSRFPVQYQRNAIASTLASRLVYAEGIHMVESQPVDRVAQRAFEYYRESRVVNKIADDLVSASAWNCILGITVILILIDWLVLMLSFSGCCWGQGIGWCREEQGGGSHPQRRRQNLFGHFLSKEALSTLELSWVDLKCWCLICWSK